MLKMSIAYSREFVRIVPSWWCFPEIGYKVLVHEVSEAQPQLFSCAVLALVLLLVTARFLIYEAPPLEESSLLLHIVLLRKVDMLF